MEYTSTIILLLACSVIINIHFIANEAKKKKSITALIERYRYIEGLSENELLIQMIRLSAEEKAELLTVILHYSDPTENNLRVAINLIQLIEQDKENPITI